MPLRRSRTAVRATTVLLLAVALLATPVGTPAASAASAAGAAGAAGAGAPAASGGGANLTPLPAAAAAAATTTVPGNTSVPRTTTTLVPLPTTPDHGPGPNPTGPKGGATSTTSPAPSTTVSPQLVSSLVRAVQGDLAQLDAIAGYDQDKGIVTVNQANAAGADSDADLASRAESDANALVSGAEATLADRERRLAALAVALYVRSDVASSPEADAATATASLNRSVILGILIAHSRDEVSRAKVQLQNDRVILQLAQQRAAGARAAQSAAHLALSKSAVELANAQLAAAGRAVAPTTGTPMPTIMGPPALSAGELAGWYSTTGYQANTTVPLATLASYYVASGTTAGLRGDIAFAQSIVETGYFSFPGGGQVSGSDNNFAGIGACDTCAHGWRFPDAKTGVAAQVQLLQAYASTKKIPTPLVGRVDVAGCCQTWLALSGVWATATDYGYIILNVYREMLDWAIPQRLGAAGL